MSLALTEHKRDQRATSVWPFWLRGVDFLSGGLFGVWLFHIAHPADVRRIFLALVIGCCLFAAQARRKLFFVRLFRKIFSALVLRPKLRRTLGFSFVFLLIAKGTLKALALEYPLFDVGIFHQLLWNVSQGNGFLSSISEAEQFLRDHFVLSLSVFTPLYRLAALSPWTLGAAPGFLAGALLASVFSAWWYLAEKFPATSLHRRAWVASALILAAFGFETFYGNLHWGLHENLAGAAFFSWGLCVYFVHSKENGMKGVMGFLGALILLVLAAISKESYLLVIAFASMGLVLAEKRFGRKAVFTALTVSCLAVFVWYAQSNRDPGKNYFTRYYGYLGSDLKSMIQTLIFHPITAVQGMPLKQDFKYLLQIVFPLGLLPLSILSYRLMKEPGTQSVSRWSWAIAIGLLPPIGSGLLATHDTLRDPGLHYFFEFVPVLGVLTLFALFSLRARLAQRWAFVLILVSWFCFWSEPWRDLTPSALAAYRNTALIEKMNRIPQDAVVMTQNGAGPWLASRRKAADWPNLKAIGGFCPDYFVFEADPAIPAEKLQKFTEIEQVLKQCANGSRPSRVDLVDSSGHWWIVKRRDG
ncbi:MAG: DUF2079 domain-containing protein [Bdellovibrionia bacterium]